MGDLVPRPERGLAPLERLHQELAEAASERSIPRLQRVIGAATIAAEAQRKVARLAEGHGQPAEIVDAAREGARQAATVQIEAVAAAGRILAEMAQTGEIPNQAERGRMGGEAKAGRGKSEPQTSYEAVGIPKQTAQGWRKVGEIPDEVRNEYVEQATEENKDVSVSGLLRYAAGPKEEAQGRDNLEVAYDDVVRALTTVTRYDPGIIFGHAASTKRRTKFRELLVKVEAWVERAKKGYEDV